MANASVTKQKLETEISSKIGTAFDIDASTTCKMSGDASQTMSGVNISGSTDVVLKQINSLENLCQAQQIMDLDVFNTLSSSVKNDILKEAMQEGGLGVNVTDSTQDITTQISNEVDIDIALDMSKKCLASIDASQKMEDVRIDKSTNINLTQESQSFNKCIFDSATKIAQENNFDLKSDTKSIEKTTQKGWDPIQSLANLGMSYVTAMLTSILIPVIICVIISIASSVMGGIGKGNTPPNFSGVGNPLVAGKNMLGGFVNVPSKIRKLFRGKSTNKILLIIVIVGILFYLISKNYRNSTRENYHSPTLIHNHRNLNNKYYAPSYVLKNYPTNEIPTYVQRL